MRLRERLAWLRERLGRAAIPDAAIEAEVLLRHALDMDRVRLFMALEEELSPGQEQLLQQLAARRLEGEPLAYITGRREFYGLEFLVSPHVLVPRQETELLVDMALEAARARGPGRLLVADIGTGSGCIAIAIARSLPQAVVYATDISPEALAIADANRRRHGVEGRVRLLQGDLLDPLPEAVDIIVSNPPYIPTARLGQLAPEVRREPRPALDGGPDGLRAISRLLEQVPARLRPGGVACIELSPEQAETVLGMAARALPSARVSVHSDMLGLARALRIQAAGQPALSTHRR